jgi:hypothetical protein
MAVNLFPTPIHPSHFSVFDRATISVVTRRRWDSFGRRHKTIPKTRQARIEDLARGLAEKFIAGGWHMVGPLISDYRWLAEQIAPLLPASCESEIRHGDLSANG